LRDVAIDLLALLPGILYVIVLLRLTKYRRSDAGLPVPGAFRQMRPDLYTDDGQHLVKLLWACAILAIPWAILVLLVLGASSA
jgi:hypothetical protein